MKKNIKRCSWSELGGEMMLYHDTEWGVPVHDERKLFEFLTLEGFQAGLSWSTILNKRDNFRKLFLEFDYKKIAAFTARDVARLMKEEGIIRNRLKIESAITNAQSFIKAQREFGTFDNYIWSFVEDKPIKNAFKRLQDIPATTLLSDILSQDLKKRGFRFVGSTIIYAHIQATGMVNDHVTSCFRYKQVG